VTFVFFALNKYYDHGKKSVGIPDNMVQLFLEAVISYMLLTLVILSADNIKVKGL